MLPGHLLCFLIILYTWPGLKNSFAEILRREILRKERFQHSTFIMTERGEYMMSPDRPDLDFLLRDSADNGFRGFFLHYQPQFRTASGALYGAEALARWRCARYGSVAPDEFIPILEESGRIAGFGKWVFREAAARCAQWRRKRPDFRMSVNLSCRDLEQGDMERFALATLRRLGLPAENMVLELTESWPVPDSRGKDETVMRLRRTGMELAMDDFGSGYSSLLSLQKFPFDLVKIDKAFIKGAAQGGARAAFVPSLARLCHSIGCQVCLEGVETKEEYEAVKPLGIEVMQGYYFGRPVPAEEFERLYL